MKCAAASPLPRGSLIAGYGPIVLSLILLLPASWAGASIPYASCFARSAVDHHLAEDLLIAVSATESAWNANARSHANAHGLMQIQWPGTAKHLGVRRVSDLYKPCTNIDLGARYLRELLDSFDGDEKMALAAYNYGPTRIRKAKTLPSGALKYIATVDKHRRKLPKAKQPATRKAAQRAVAGKRQRVLVFSSRARANRYLKVLEQRIAGAVFTTQRTAQGSHAIDMAVGKNGLNAQEQTVLKTLGWTP
ncbi:MAG: lytic transglycosylase domain-containing protein [Pseudomonadales bacterium]